MTRYDVVFDGGSLGNPGQGYGSYRLRPAGGEWSPPVRLDYGDGVTNNEAEYRTLIAALDALAAAHADPRDVAVTVYGDSQLVIRQLEGKWRVRAANLFPFWAAARESAARFGRMTYTWQRRDISVALLGH